VLPAPDSTATSRASISARVLSDTISDCPISTDTGWDRAAASCSAPAGAVPTLTLTPPPSAAAKAAPARPTGSALREEL